MARPRKPTAIKKLQGTLQKCRTNNDEPQPATKLKQVAPPSHLSKVAKDAWEFAISQCPDGVLTSLDFAIFEMWCDTYARILDTEAILKEEGNYVRNPDTGISYPHPALKQLEGLKYTLKYHATELGFTPASRSKVHVIKKEDSKKTNKFIDL